MTSSADFLSIPQELRVLVYGCLFEALDRPGNAMPIVQPASSRHTAISLESESLYRPDIPRDILAICSLIREEALPIFHSKVHLGLHFAKAKAGFLTWRALGDSITTFTLQASVWSHNIRYLDVGIYDLSAALPQVVKETNSDLSAESLEPYLPLSTRFANYGAQLSRDKKLRDYVKQLSTALPNVKCIILHTTEFDRPYARTVDLNVVEYVKSLKLHGLFPKLKEIRHLDLTEISTDWDVPEDEYAITLQRYSIVDGKLLRWDAFEDGVRSCGSVEMEAEKGSNSVQ